MLLGIATNLFYRFGKIYNRLAVQRPIGCLLRAYGYGRLSCHDNNNRYCGQDVRFFFGQRNPGHCLLRKSEAMIHIVVAMFGRKSLMAHISRDGFWELLRPGVCRIRVFCKQRRNKQLHLLV